MLHAKSLLEKVEKPLRIYDYIIFLLLAGFCFITFSQGDIQHTAGSSFAYLNGHILDFYEYNVQYVGGNAYMASSYIIFAIWNIPIKLLGLVTVPTADSGFFVLMWYKLLPTIFYFLSAVCLYKIACELGMGTKKAKLCSYVFLTTPIGFFSQFIFGQYDSITVFFTLVGFLYFLRRDLLKFAIFTGIAMTFKYTPFILFVPLLMLVEKRVVRLIEYVFVCLMPIALEILVYLPSPAFRSGVLHFSAPGYLFETGFTTQFYHLSVFIVVYILIVALAYFKDLDLDKELGIWSVYCSNIIMFLVFGISMWHPQWLLFAVPFLVLGAFCNRKFDIFMLVDFLLMVVFVLFTVNYFQDHVDQNLFTAGIFKYMVGSRINSALTMRAIFRFNDMDMFFSIFSGLMLVCAVFKHPKYAVEPLSSPIDEHWPLVRARFLAGLAVFLIPAFMCFFAALSAPYPQFSRTDTSGLVNSLTVGQSVAQVYVAGSSELNRIDVFVGTFARTNDSNLNIDITDLETNKTSRIIQLDAANLIDGAYNEIEFAAIPTVIGRRYAISFYSDDATDESCITIYRTTAGEIDFVDYALAGKSICSYDLCIKLFGPNEIGK